MGNGDSSSVIFGSALSLFIGAFVGWFWMISRSWQAQWVRKLSTGSALSLVVVCIGPLGKWGVIPSTCYGAFNVLGIIVGVCTGGQWVINGLAAGAHGLPRERRAEVKK